MDIRLNVCVFGDAGCGKTAILNRYVSNTFDYSQKPTLCVEYLVKHVTYGFHNVTLNLHDTAGQEQYRSLVDKYYKIASGVFLIFDLTNQSSFDSLKSWLTDIYDHLGMESAVIILLGNKADLEDQRVIPTEKAQDFANSNDLEYFETSALNGYNIDDAFLALTKMMVERSRPDISQSNEVDLNAANKEGNSSCC